MTKTKIEWTDAVWNPVTGCTPVSPGCQNCWARRMAQRQKGRNGYPVDEPFRVTVHRNRLVEPLRWRKSRRVFVCSMGDLFHEDVPDLFISEVFKVMLDCWPRHVFQVLTKRPQRMAAWFAGFYGNQKPSTNVWLGVTVEDQERADERIPVLLKIPAVMRFVSYEPALGAVDLRRYLYSDYDKAAMDNQLLTPIKGFNYAKVNWVIAGCESGPKRRPAPAHWFRNVRRQCEAAGVPFFLKQLVIDDELIKMPDLDGRVWDQVPEVTETCRSATPAARRS